MNLELTATLALVIYAMTFLFTSSHALKGLRERFGEILDAVFPDREYRMEECRMCMGFWLTVGLFLSLLPTEAVSLHHWLNFSAAYGLSYFLATQER